MILSARRPDDYDLRDLFMHAPVAIAIYRGPEFIIELANERILEFWDRTEKEALNKPLLEALPEVHDQGIFEILQRVYQTGERYVAPEYPLLLFRNGEMQSVFVSFTLEPLRSYDDESGSVMIVASEVTELVRARQAAEESRLLLERKVEERTLELGQRTEELRKQKEFLETILDSSVDLIGVYDYDTRIVAFNRRCEEVYHLKREDVLGRPFAEVFPWAVGSRSHQDLLLTLNGEAVHNEVYRSPYTGRFLENFLLPLRDENQRIYGALVIAHDITEIQEATQKLRHTNAALEKSNHDLEQFAYVASHDLQEPLRKISTFSELLRRNSPDLSPQAHQYVDKILRSSHRMADLIHDVLSYSRLSKPGEQYLDTDLNDILENILTDYELLIRQKNATIHRGSLPVVRAIPLQMHQLFSNLLANALKFSRGEPVIQITARRLDDLEVRGDHKLEPGGSYMEILFKDNGIGFEQQYAEQIFTIFQRLNSREDYQGTGIGLALCKKIIDNHGGSIHATSALDQGAAFHLRLPVIS